MFVLNYVTVCLPQVEPAIGEQNVKCCYIEKVPTQVMHLYFLFSLLCHSELCSSSDCADISALDDVIDICGI